MASLFASAFDGLCQSEGLEALERWQPGGVLAIACNGTASYLIIYMDN